MYGVSAEYISAMNSPIQKHEISGTIGGVNFTSSDILYGSMTVQNQCSDSKDLSVGSVYVGVLKFTLISDLNIKRGTWLGKEIRLNFSQLVNEAEDVWETIPVGVYIVSEANHSEKGVEVTAYDFMQKLDKDYPATATNGTVFDIMTLVCSKCGVEFGLTKEETEALPNGKFILGIYPDNDCKTWRDIVHYLAQVVGGFATAGRDGKILLKSFGNPTGFVVDATKRLTGSKFSDYTTNYTGLSVVNMAEKVTRYVHTFLDNGLTVNLGSNPFMQYGTTETIESMLNNVLEAVNNVRFIPFSSSMVGNPAFDLGDILTFTEGTAGVTSSCCLMSYNWKFNKSYAVNGFGKNPSLANAQSKAEKDISGLSQQTKADKIAFFTYENAQVLNITSEQIVCDLSATNTSNTLVDFWIEFKMNVSVTGEQAVLNFRYLLDGVEEFYKPTTTYNHDGTYILGLHYYMRFEEVLQHNFKVLLEVVGGSVEILVGDIHAVIKGQGMALGAAWDGKIELTEQYSLNARGGMTVAFNDELISISQQQPVTSSFADNFAAVQSGVYEIGFTDDINIIMQTNIFELTTEDGVQLVTEAGDPIITDGGREDGGTD